MKKLEQTYPIYVPTCMFVLMKIVIDIIENPEER